MTPIRLLASILSCLVVLASCSSTEPADLILQNATVCTMEEEQPWASAIAIRGGGLVAPAIHDTDQLPLDALMEQLRDLTGRVRAGRFRSSEMADPTVTVSSLGERGVEALYGVIYPPQVALVGLGNVVERPWAVGGEVAVRSVVTATLSADHRVSDGHRGALFLRKVDEWLQDPEAL